MDAELPRCKDPITLSENWKIHIHYHQQSWNEDFFFFFITDATLPIFQPVTLKPIFHTEKLRELIPPPIQRGVAGNPFIPPIVIRFHFWEPRNLRTVETLLFWVPKTSPTFSQTRCGWLEKKRSSESIIFIETGYTPKKRETNTNSCASSFREAGCNQASLI
jgi:hypothetical protein